MVMHLLKLSHSYKLLTVDLIMKKLCHNSAINRVTAYRQTTVLYLIPLYFLHRQTLRNYRRNRKVPKGDQREDSNR